MLIDKIKEINSIKLFIFYLLIKSHKTILLLNLSILQQQQQTTATTTTTINTTKFFRLLQMRQWVS